MTISNSSRTAGPFVGNNVTASFPFSFKVFSRTDLLVAKMDTATSNETILSQGVDYNVSLNPDQNHTPGGTITLTAPLPIGYTLSATSDMPIVQPLDLTNGGGFYPKAINDVLDRIVINLQQVASRVGIGWNISTSAVINNFLSFKDTLAGSTGATLLGYIQTGAQAIKRTIAEKLSDTLNAKDYGVVGDGVTDDYTAFVRAVAASASKNKPLIIADLKIYLATQNAPINLDGARIIGNGKLQKPNAELAYLNGADQALSVWNFMRTARGAGIFSRYNGAIFTGMDFPVWDFAVVGDYNKAGQFLFLQSAPTVYPGWSQALINTNVDGYLFGNDGIRLLGGLELGALRNINIWFCGGYCLNIGMTNGINCPVEYLHIDESCSFIYGKLGNVWFNGFRRNIKMEGVLLNGAGHYDARRLANPAFTVASQDAIVAPVRVTALAPGLYDGVNHSGSDQFEMERCYAEVAQGILQTDGASINNIEHKHNTLLPWDNAQPRNLLAIKNAVYRLRTSGNGNIDGTFPIYIAPAVVAQAADYLIEEATVPSAVSFVGAKPLDPALTPPPSWNQQSYPLGDGTAGTFTYSLAINQQTPINNASATALWMVSANFQDQQFDRNESVLIAVARMSSGNYTYQLINQPPTVNLFSAPPSVNAAGLLQVPLTLYSRARVTRIDSQPLRVV